MAQDDSLTIDTTQRVRASGSSLSNPRFPRPPIGGIEYRSHVQGVGWESSWSSNGDTSGTTGQSKRIEVVQIRLTGILRRPTTSSAACTARRTAGSAGPATTRPPETAASPRVLRQSTRRLFHRTPFLLAPGRKDGLGEGIAKPVAAWAYSYRFDRDVCGGACVVKLSLAEEKQGERPNAEYV